jgi:hypothetical protein
MERIFLPGHHEIADFFFLSSVSNNTHFIEKTKYVTHCALLKH